MAIGSRQLKAQFRKFVNIRLSVTSKFVTIRISVTSLSVTSIMRTRSIFNLIITACLISTTACNNDVKKDESEKISTDVIDVPSTASGIPAQAGTAPQMVFSEEKHDFGKITQGEKVSYSFVFKNTGGSDLVISSALGSCGCTVPTFPKEPVKPGQEGKIDVVFDSEGKSGLVEKTVTMTTNCNPSAKILTINATVNVPEED